MFKKGIAEGESNRRRSEGRMVQIHGHVNGMAKLAIDIEEILQVVAAASEMYPKPFLLSDYHLLASVCQCFGD
jgi:hypothetical protein